ncbi:MAG: hypothetical protein ACK5TU_14835 [Cyclobacteriaceae bacterium]
MKKTIILTSTLLLISLISYGQSDSQKDSLINEICKSIIENAGASDSIKITVAYDRHLIPYLSKYSKEEQEKIWETLYYRMQRNCKEFKEIDDKVTEQKGDWKSVDKKPEAMLSKKTCKDFLKYKKYKYLEASGDTVNLSIENGIWIDRFKDGTYSKLKFIWVSDCEFDIEFIESDNRLRKNFSKPGDKYRYQIIDKKRTYYDMSVEILGTNRYMTFKIYY